MKNEKGFALVITLVVSALLVALVAEFVNEVYVDTSSRQNFVDGQQASILAESGVAGGIKVLQLTMASQGFTSLLDPWAKPLKLDDEQGTIEVTIEDEAAKINLNSIAGANGNFIDAYYPLATRFLKKVGLTPDLCDGIADWIDTNDEPKPAGGETTYYRTLQSPYGAKNAWFDTVDELRLVKGFDAKTMERLHPFITVFANSLPGSPAPVNINTAPPEVLAALDEGLSDDLVGRIMDYRKTTPFKSPADILKVAGLDKIGIALQTRIQTKSTVYRLVSRGQVNETARIIETVVRIDGSQATMLYWREY